MIPDLAQSLGRGRLDAIRRRMHRAQRGNGASSAARQRIDQRRAAWRAGSVRPIPTTLAQILQSIMGKARGGGGSRSPDPALLHVQPLNRASPPVRSPQVGTHEPRHIKLLSPETGKRPEQLRCEAACSV